MNDDLLEELFNVVFELGGTIEPILEEEPVSPTVSDSPRQSSTGEGEQ